MSPCCCRCGADGHLVSKTACAFEALTDDKPKQSTQLPEGTMAEADTNVYVDMCLEREETATHRCEYALCEDKSTHLTPPCPTLHANSAATGWNNRLTASSSACRWARRRSTTTRFGLRLYSVSPSRKSQTRADTPNAAGFYPCVGKIY